MTVSFNMSLLTKFSGMAVVSSSGVVSLEGISFGPTVLFFSGKGVHLRGLAVLGSLVEENTNFQKKINIFVSSLNVYLYST